MKNTKKVIGVISIILILLIIGIIYVQFFSKELDANSHNSPIESEKITLQDKLLMNEKLTLSAGFAYDRYNDRFFISTDTPHSIFVKKEAQIFILDKSLKNIISSTVMQTEGDLEGMVVIDKNTLKILSDSGELFTILVNEDNSMEVVSSKQIFTDNKKHKPGSLTFDGKNLITAEKEGRKIFYKLSLDGEILEQFKLKDFPNETEFTISGMTSSNGYVYVLSEAYSTIFKIYIEKKIIEKSYEIQEMNECSGITSDGELFYCVGDGESYIPEQNFYIFKIK